MRCCVNCMHVPWKGYQFTDEDVLQWAKQYGWQRCSGCEHLVELAGGCNHINSIFSATKCVLMLIDTLADSWRCQKWILLRL